MTTRDVSVREGQLEKVKMAKEKPYVTVGAKRIMEYVLECLSWFNRGYDEVMVRSFEQSICRGAEVSQILAEHLGVQILASNIRQLERKHTHFTCLETILKWVETSGAKEDFVLDPGADFVEFPVYQLLLDSLLYEKKKLIISNYGGSSGANRGQQANQLLTVNISERGFLCAPGQDLLQIIGRKTEDMEKRQQLLGDLVSAFCRCGLILSSHWDEASAELSDFDDVVLGIDTNILYNCSISQQLLDGFVIAGPFHHFHTPNWILIIVPSAVMHEIEQAANRKDKTGRFLFEGRMGYRALQEIMELDRSKDIMGVSLLIVGEADPALDTRVELRGLREDMKETAPVPIRPRLARKLSAGDTIIRDQFKCFLQKISFHKGAFFVTADKANAALAQAEGLHSIYYPAESWKALLSGQKLEPPSIEFESENVTLGLPFGKLIYELAVEFGEICISWDNNEIKIECDSRGETLDHWINRDLHIDNIERKKLMANYNTCGRVSLARVSHMWRDLGGHLAGWLR